jgi:hypothetical protein
MQCSILPKIQYPYANHINSQQRTTMKKRLILGGIIVAIAGAGFWFVSSGSLNALIKEQIEGQGSKYTEQKVAVKSVEVKLLEGFGSIKGLTLNNPQGFKQPYALSLGDITLDININSLVNIHSETEAIIIDTIKIADPKAFVELTANGRTNFSQIMDAINKNLPQSTSTPVAQDSSTGPEPKVKITHLIVSGVALTLDLSALGNKGHKVQLSDIKLNNIGGAKGLPASQLGGEVAKQVIKAIAKEAKDEQTRQLKDKAIEKIKEKAKEKLSGLFDKLGG